MLSQPRAEVYHKPGQGVTLYIALLRVTDSGQYTCTVNRNREVLTLLHQLIVEVPSYIESLYPLNGSVTVHSGSRVRLECRAGGQPPPTVFWKRLVGTREMENMSRGPTFRNFVTIRTGESMQDITVAGLQSTRVQTSLSPPLLNVLYCVRVSLWTVKIFLSQHFREGGRG
jgi:hypothetical protein